MWRKGDPRNVNWCRYYGNKKVPQKIRNTTTIQSSNSEFLAAAKTLQGDILSFIKWTSLKSPLHIIIHLTNICHFKNGRVELMSPDQEPFRPDTRKDMTP